MSLAKNILIFISLIFISLSVLSLAAVSLPAVADELAEDFHPSEVLFTRRVAPLLREKCAGCHGDQAEEIEGGLDVRSWEALIAGGDSGAPGIIAGEPAASSVYLAAMRTEDLYSAMPPKESEKLSEAQLVWVHDWIESGAKWPSKQLQNSIEKQYQAAWSVEDGIAIQTSGGLSPDWTNRKYDAAGLWAYQPVESSEISARSKSAIDVLIEEKIPAGLSVATRAPRRELIRRATFDLIGLPPTPEEVTAFIKDERSDEAAFAEVIDRLLRSPHYGQRMAQHWLDVVRYADSSGFANDYQRGNAWRYRDYVVRSFNDDKPYNLFVREQIAGDEMDPEDPEKIVATGFLRMGPWELTGMEVAKVARQRFLDDVTNSVGETFLAHSLQCARCHDHKFDPIPTRDYYSIQAVFATTQLTERRAEFLAEENTSGFEEQAYLTSIRQAHHQTLAQLEQVLLTNAEEWFSQQTPPLVAVKQKWDQAITKLTAAGKVDNLFNAARSEMRTSQIPESDYPPQLVGFTPQQFGRDRVAHKGLERQRWELDRYQPFALAVYNGLTKSPTSVSAPTRIPPDRLKQGELEPTAILTGGDPFSPSQPVSPGTLSVISDQIAAVIPDSIEGRRTPFADWVADPKNPLTSRVIVNRIWMWHFGEPLAGNPNNFGSTGKRPTHPRLLDWMAATFVKDGWSIKSLHRRIMTSNAYCRASDHPAVNLIRDLDPEGVSYAVFKPRRLSAEELRDSMLAITGELNPTVGGIPCRPEINQEVALQPRQVMGTFAAAWTPNPLPEQRHRRSIYVLRLRGLIDPTLEVFNTPVPDFSCEKREASTVTPQVFNLFNGQNTHARSLALASRVLKESDNDHDAIKRCFELTLSRQPSPEEVDDFVTHWRQTEKALPQEAPPRINVPLEVVREAVEENTGEKFTFVEQLYSNADFVPDLQPADVDRHTRALSDTCLVILNSNEFVYVY